MFPQTVNGESKDVLVQAPHKCFRSFSLLPSCQQRDRLSCCDPSISVLHKKLSDLEFELPAAAKQLAPEQVLQAVNFGGIGSVIAHGMSILSICLISFAVSSSNSIASLNKNARTATTIKGESLTILVT